METASRQDLSAEDVITSFSRLAEEIDRTIKNASVRTKELTKEMSLPLALSCNIASVDSFSELFEEAMTASEISGEEDLECFDEDLSEIDSILDDISFSSLNPTSPDAKYMDYTSASEMYDENIFKTEHKSFSSDDAVFNTSGYNSNSTESICSKASTRKKSKQNKCFICHQTIRDISEIGFYKRAAIHTDCLKNVCPICNNIVMDAEQVWIDGQTYHEFCCKCFLCERNIPKNKIFTRKLNSVKHLSCIFCLNKLVPPNKFIQSAPQSPMSPDNWVQPARVQNGEGIPFPRPFGSIYQSERSRRNTFDQVDGYSEKMCHICHMLIQWDEGRDLFHEKPVHVRCVQCFCPTCSEQVYFKEAIIVNGRWYHPLCHKCSRCTQLIGKGSAVTRSTKTGGKLLFHSKCSENLEKGL